MSIWYYRIPQSLQNPEHLVSRLAEFYNKDPLACANLCDDYLDRTGELLGEVRYVARNQDDSNTAV